MLNFWASWCGPCRKEMPILEQLNKQYRGKGFTLVGVNVEPDSQRGAELAEGHTCLLSDTLRHRQQGQ